MAINFTILVWTYTVYPYHKYVLSLSANYSILFLEHGTGTMKSIFIPLLLEMLSSLSKEREKVQCSFIKKVNSIQNFKELRTMSRVQYVSWMTINMGVLWYKDLKHILFVRYWTMFWQPVPVHRQLQSNHTRFCTEYNLITPLSAQSTI